MLSNKLTITGIVEGVTLITFSYDGVLTFHQIEELCDTIRKPLNELGERVTLNVTIIDDNF